MDNDVIARIERHDYRDPLGHPLVNDVDWLAVKGGNQALADLVAKWRSEADTCTNTCSNEDRGYNNAQYQLADELEAALTSPQADKARGEADWRLVKPDGTEVCREPSLALALARLEGYKLTVEGFLALEQAGWRVLPCGGGGMSLDPQLAAFYQVTTVAGLLAAQGEHIQTLQDAARRNVKPWEDTFPPTLLPKYMRDSGLLDGEGKAALAAELQRIDNISAAIGGTPEIARMYEVACIEFVRHPALLSLLAPQETKP